MGSAEGEAGITTKEKIMITKEQVEYARNEAFQAYMKHKDSKDKLQEQVTMSEYVKAWQHYQQLDMALFLQQVSEL
jgi:hypothetical protein